MSSRARRTLISLVVFFCVCGLAGMFISQKVGAQSSTDESAFRDSLKQFTNVYQIVAQNYAEPLTGDKPDDAIYDGAIPEMLRTLDPHSNFYDPKAYAKMQEDESGKYYGVGMVIQPQNNKIVIVYPFEGSPAYNAGLKPADVILTVDGKPTKGLDSSAVADLLKGPKGTKVHITVSREGSERLIRAAIDYALSHKRKSVTLVHKGNIMKFTEGAFRDWGYEVTRREYKGRAVGWDDCGGNPPPGQILVKDNIADITFQQCLTRPDEFDVIATMNLNGDYLSDALAAQVGGIGIAPGANINYISGHAIFEATHGTAPKYANQDKVNPGSVILSGVLMFEHLGWQEVADGIIRGMERTIANKTVTYDFERLMDGAKLLKCSEFGKAIIENM